MTDRDQNPLSRRTFLLAAGTATAGLSTHFGRARADLAPGGSVAVEGSRRHRPLSEAVADELRRDHGDAAFAVLHSGTAEGFRRFAAGAVDAHVASRPMVSAERETAAENDVDYESVELALDAAALVHPERAWYDCATESRLVEAWRDESDAPVYAEVADDAPPDAAASRGEGRHGSAPSSDATVVVRGTREFQYERGFGGVGYYEPEPGNVRPLAEVRRSGVESYTPLVRLGFLYLNRASLERVGADRLKEAYLDRVARRTGEVTYFADSTGLTA